MNDHLDNTIKEAQKLIWDAATINSDNPLGYRILDGHFGAIRRIIESRAKDAAIYELNHIEGQKGSYWWGEKSTQRDIAMTVKERITEIEGATHE